MNDHYRIIVCNSIQDILNDIGKDDGATTDIELTTMLKAKIAARCLALGGLEWDGKLNPYPVAMPGSWHGVYATLTPLPGSGKPMRYLWFKPVFAEDES